MVNICFIGSGYVGLTSGVCLASKGHNVILVDNNTEKIEMLRRKKSPIYEPGLEELLISNFARLKFSTSIEEGVKSSEAIFISVPTPPDEKGAANLSYVEAVSEEIAKHLLNGLKVIVEKSTVPVNTGNRIEQILKKYSVNGSKYVVVSNPEFMREGCAVNDFLNPDRIVIGINDNHPFLSEAKQLMDEIYCSFNCQKLYMDRASAEMAKLASNGFLATKISFTNFIADLCEKTGANIEEVTRAMGMDPRIGHHFLSAGLGYGGSCFGKDGDAVIHLARLHDVDPALLKEGRIINDERRNKAHRIIREGLGNDLSGKTIGVLGCAFKPNTDDIRDAPAIDIIKMLVSGGATVNLHDYKALENARNALEHLSGIYYFDNPIDALKKADGIILCTEWKEYKDLDYIRIIQFCNGIFPLFLDGRNLLDPKKMRAAGFNYLSIGRP